MPRPRKGTSEVFYDTFSSFPLDEQAIALRIMTEIHRQAAKREPRTIEEFSRRIFSSEVGKETGGN